MVDKFTLYSASYDQNRFHMCLNMLRYMRKSGFSHTHVHKHMEWDQRIWFAFIWGACIFVLIYKIVVQWSYQQSVVFGWQVSLFDRKAYRQRLLNFEPSKQKLNINKSSLSSSPSSINCAKSFGFSWSQINRKQIDWESIPTTATTTDSFVQKVSAK